MKSYYLQMVLSEKELKNLRVVLGPLDDHPQVKRILNSLSEIEPISWSHKTVVFDYDNTITEYTEDLGDLGTIKEGFKEVYEYVREKGYRVGILTGRPDNQAEEISLQMEEAGMPVDFVQMDPENPEKSTKPHADLYVDDRGFRHTGNWSEDTEIFKQLLDAVS